MAYGLDALRSSSAAQRFAVDCIYSVLMLF